MKNGPYDPLRAVREPPSRRFLRDEKPTFYPNHMHGVIVLSDDCRGGSRTALKEVSV